MVAIIKSGSSLHRIFNYNEQKVSQGVAQCILAENYPMEVEDLGANQKLNRLLNQARLNENVKRNSIHISLNFAPGEQLTMDQLAELSRDYMAAIGFAEQPFLVYRHDDAAHPHIHIVTTKIRPDGSRIDTQNIGRNKSEPARQLLEKNYGLVKAEDQKKDIYKVKPILNDVAEYGKTPTKRAITNVLEYVLNRYAYTSIPELNAVLNNYHVMADRGKENSRVYQHSGLYYQLTDKGGTRVGVPVKASRIHFNPGLKYLQLQFEKNRVRRNNGKQQLKEAIDLVLKNHPKSMQQLVFLLRKSNVQLVTRANADGVIFGLTYIDHRSKCVFKGSALGKAYSAKAVCEIINHAQVNRGIEANHSRFDTASFRDSSNVPSPDASLVHLLTQAEETYEPLPFQLKMSGRKRKKRRKINT
ncbi:relaxase/mobilization nuclease domain-containing protein [Arcticibacter sp.]|uniref:relaxase/mobilization nuclease domain-containing protein n=1 Tax=Arcticibacter sp. TaxID=1872630 RepID=UPI003890F35D